MIAMMITMTTPSPICQHEARRWCWRSSSPPHSTRPTLPKNHFWIKILLQLMQTYPHDQGTWYRGENKDCSRDEHKEQRSEGINLIRILIGYDYVLYISSNDIYHDVLCDDWELSPSQASRFQDILLSTTGFF